MESKYGRRGSTVSFRDLRIQQLQSEVERLNDGIDCQRLLTVGNEKLRAEVEQLQKSVTRLLEYLGVTGGLQDYRDWCVREERE